LILEPINNGFCRTHLHGNSIQPFWKKGDLEKKTPILKKEPFYNGKPKLGEFKRIPQAWRPERLKRQKGAQLGCPLWDLGGSPGEKNQKKTPGRAFLEKFS